MVRGDLNLLAPASSSFLHTLGSVFLSALSRLFFGHSPLISLISLAFWIGCLSDGKDDPESVFDSLDTDGSGVLSAEEMAVFAETMNPQKKGKKKGKKGKKKGRR